MSDKEIKILAIESSCDETAAAVVVNGSQCLRLYCKGKRKR